MTGTFIYMLVDEDNAPLYVGKSTNPSRRFARHKPIHPLAVTFLIIEWIPDGQDWQERERAWIAYYKQWYPLENLRPGGNGPGGTLSETTKSRIRTTLAAMPPEVKEAVNSRRVESNTGQKRSDETRRKMSKSAEGGLLSERTRMILRIINLGRRCPNIIQLALHGPSTRVKSKILREVKKKR